MKASLAPDDPRTKMGEPPASEDSIVKDEPTKGFDKLREEGEVSAWIAFACRILLDIQGILGTQIFCGWEEVRRDFRSAKESLRIKVLQNGQMMTGEALA